MMRLGNTVSVFQSTLSVRRATVVGQVRGFTVVFQSTLSVRRATSTPSDCQPNPFISIHALRKESDWSLTHSRMTCLAFQSTLSVRRATKIHGDAAHPYAISIHALRKESDKGGTDYTQEEEISIHALRKESDSPTGVLVVGLDISIHALRKESDRAAGHFCPLSETQASCLALSISNNTTGTTNNMPKTSSCLSVSF